MRNDPKIRSRLRIGLLEAQPIRAAGFRCVFDDKSRLEIVPAGVDELVADTTLSVALLGLHDSADCFDILSAIKAARPQIRLILMGSGGSDEMIINAIAAGAKGYLDETATPEQVEQAVEVVFGGSIWAPRRVLALFIDRVIQSSSARALRRNNSHFTDREREVLKLLVSARSNREIAEFLKIEERTVKAHIARLMRKVGVDNRIALSVHAVTHDLVSRDSSSSA